MFILATRALDAWSRMHTTALEDALRITEHEVVRIADENGQSSSASSETPPGFHAGGKARHAKLPPGPGLDRRCNIPLDETQA